MDASKITSLKTVFLAAESMRSADPKNNKLLLVLHGLGDSVEGFRDLPLYLRLPGLNYLLVNAPDSYFTGYSWFDFPGNMKPGITRSRDKLFSVLTQVQSYGYTMPNIGLFGFSQGCLMAVDLACRYPAAFGAVVGVSGFVGLMEEYPEKFSPQASKQKLLITHGTEDPVLPIDAARIEFQKLKNLGIQIDWREYEKVHTLDPVAEAEDIRRFLAKTLSLDLPR